MTKKRKGNERGKKQHEDTLQATKRVVTKCTNSQTSFSHSL